MQDPAMRGTALKIIVCNLALLTVPAIAQAVGETCQMTETRRASEPPPATGEDLLIMSRKLGWVGNQLLQKGRFEEASLNLRDAFNVLVSLPEPPPLDMARLANILGFTFTMLESYSDAAPAFDLALTYLPVDDDELAAQRPPVLLNYAELHMRTGDWKAARRRLDEALQLQEKYAVPEEKRAPAYVTRGELALLSGNPAGAVQWLERADAAMAADPDAAPAHRIAVLTALRESYQLLGREEEELGVSQRMLEAQEALRKTEESL